MKLSYKISSRIQVSLLSIVMLCTGCGGREAVELPQGEKKFVYKEKLYSFPLDSIADRLWAFIPETNDNALLGSIERVIMHDSILYIYDTHKQVVAFDTTGQHKFTIHNIGGGPGEYTYLDDFALDKKNNQLLLLADKKIINYNLDGTYAGKETQLDDYVNEMVVDGEIVYMRPDTYSGLILKSNNLWLTNMSDNQKTEYMPTLPEYAPFCVFCGRYMNHTADGRVHFMRKFDHNIYLLKPDSYEAEYYIDWGDSQFVPKEGAQYGCSEINGECFERQKIYSILNFQEGKTFITLQTNYPVFFLRRQKNG